MKNRVCNLSELSSYEKNKISTYLSNSDLLKLMTTSKNNYSYFKNALFFSKALEDAAKGEYEVFEEILQQDFKLAFRKGNVTDNSGRTFNNISAFEYALWALDNNLWIIILDNLAQGENKQYIETLVAQYKRLKEEGVSYMLKDQRINEKHFDFSGTLLQALERQVELQTAAVRDDKVIVQQWQKEVGGAQKLLPMHVVYRYCMRRTYDDYHQPNDSSHFFNYKEKKRFINTLIANGPKDVTKEKIQQAVKTLLIESTLPKELYNPITKKDESWFSSAGLGQTFAVQFGGMSEPFALGLKEANFFGGRIKSTDLPALKTLFDARMKDFKNLEFELEELQKEYETSQRSAASSL